MVAEFWADAGEATIDAHIATACKVAARGRRRDIMTCTVHSGTKPDSGAWTKRPNKLDSG